MLPTNRIFATKSMITRENELALFAFLWVCYGLEANDPRFDGKLKISNDPSKCLKTRGDVKMEIRAHAIFPDLAARGKNGHSHSRLSNVLNLLSRARQQAVVFDFYHSLLGMVVDQAGY